MRPTERPAPSRGPDPHPGPGWRARLPAALKASGAWRKTGAAAFLLLLAAACLPDRAPSGLALMTVRSSCKASGSTPSISAGGERLVRSGWADPKGGSAALLSLPENTGSPAVFWLSARWTDLRENVGYRGQIEVPLSELAVRELSRPTADVIVLFGPDGYLELSTSAEPDAAGQYNGRVVATACADPGPGLAAGHWAWSEARLDRNAEALRTGCAQIAP